MNPLDHNTHPANLILHDASPYVLRMCVRLVSQTQVSSLCSSCPLLFEVGGDHRNSPVTSVLVVLKSQNYKNTTSLIYLALFCFVLFGKNELTNSTLLENKAFFYLVLEISIKMETQTFFFHCFTFHSR